MPLKGAPVVIVDDESALLEIFTRWLEREGCSVLCAENGAEALALIEAHRPRVVVSDVRMPVMGGLELARHLVARGGPVPKIALISGFSDHGERECYHVGVEAFLAKPVDRPEFVAALRRCLTDRGSLWRKAPDDPSGQTLEAAFASLAAGQDGGLAMGRGGFCIRSGLAAAVNARIGFALSFEAEARRVVGQGIVRWTDAQDGLVGVEITHVEDAQRDWVVDLAGQVAPSGPFIPRSCAAS